MVWKSKAKALPMLAKSNMEDLDAMEGKFCKKNFQRSNLESTRLVHWQMENAGKTS